MLWLKGLKKVKEELRGERWPQSAQEGFSIGISLMAHALEDLKKNMQKKMPGANGRRIQLEIRRTLLRFNKTDSRWIARYKRDYAQLRPR